MLKQFAKFSPCVYAGEVPCCECAVIIYSDECDMKEGRERKQQAFVAGAKAGLEIAVLIIDEVGKCKVPPECFDENRSCHFCAQTAIRKKAREL